MSYCMAISVPDAEEGTFWVDVNNFGFFLLYSPLATQDNETAAQM